MREKLVLFGAVLVLTFGTERYATGQWQQTNGPYGGEVECFAVIDTNLFAGTWGGGVLLSSNNGTSWTPVNSGLSNLYVHALTVSGKNIYAGTWGGGVFLSSNNGTSWIPINAGLTNTLVQALGVSGTNLLAGTTNDGNSGNGNVFLSTNNGISWTEIDDSMPVYTNVAAFVRIGANIIAGTGGGPELSTNNGISWTADTSGLQAQYAGFNCFAVIGSDLFAGSWGNGLFLSTNKGMTWIAIDSGISPSFLNITALSASGMNLFVGTWDGAVGKVLRSIDSGKSWTEVNTGLTDNYIYCFAVCRSQFFAGTSSSGVLRTSNNGTNWVAVNNGLAGGDAYALVVSGTNLFAGTSDGVFLTPDQGKSWSKVNAGLLNTYVQALAVKGTKLFAGTNGGVFQSSDNGTQWVASNDGIPPNTYATSLMVSGKNLFAGADRSLFLSTNNGTSWSTANSGLGGSIVTLAAITETNARGFPITNIFAGTNQSRNFSSVYFSTDDGSSWTQGGTFDRTLSSLATIGSNLFVATDGGVFLSTDGAITWTRVSTGLTTDTVYALGVVGSNLLAGTLDGIFLSTDSGTTWNNINRGMMTTDVMSFAVCGLYVFAGTYGSSVWRRPLSEMIPTNAVAPARTIERTIAAYPNPFTQSTTISISSPEGDAAHVTIVNILGEEVARLSEREMTSAGGELPAASFTWDARGVPPGVYWSEVRMNGRVERTALVLEK